MNSEDSHALQDIMANVRHIMVHCIPTSFDPIDILRDDVHFHLRRNASIKNENEVPVDLLNALNKKHISIQHLPKELINESLFIEFCMPKSKCIGCTLHTSYVVQCEVALRRKGNVIVCDNTFAYTISDVSSS